MCCTTLSAVAPLSDPPNLDVFLLNCLVLKKGRELQVNLIILNFDVILRMDWLSQHFATVDCRRKEVMFRTPNVEKLKVVCDESSAPQNLISASIAIEMLG